MSEQAPAQGQPEEVDATATEAVSPSNTWDSAFDEETKSYVKGKGWNEPSDMLQSYRNLERLFTADKLGHTVAIPKEGDTEAWGKFYSRIGRPEAPDGYDFSAPEGQDGQFAEWAKGVFHEAGLSKSQANAISAKWNEYIGNQQSSMNEASVAALEDQHNALKREWGAAYDQKIATAQRAAQTFGLDGDTVDKLEKVMGFDGVMQFMSRIGEGMGEDKFIEGKPASGGAMTPAQAMDELRKLGSDKEFMTAWLDPTHPGHADAKDRKSRLSSWAFPQ